MSGQLEFIDVDPSDPEAAALVAALDADLLERYPGIPIYGIVSAGFRASGGLFLIGRIDGCNAACGALRPIDADAVEVKRMFVRPEFRRRGLARAMLATLEAAARERGYRTIRLETGDGQPEAIALYRSAGYGPIPCYGEYAVHSDTVCFEKALRA
jgi:GNAT superfamily N-acetyltransferase